MSDKQNTLAIIQSKIKVPKSRFNKSGQFHFRNVEDILEGLKPLLTEMDADITLDDEVELIGNRYYIKATATVTFGDGSTACSSAYAREDEVSAKLSGPQLTGAASSYARKSALCGLLALDDSEDADATEQPVLDVEELRAGLRTLIVASGAKAAGEKLAKKLEEFGIKNLSGVSTIEDPKVLAALITEMNTPAQGSV